MSNLKDFLNRLRRRQDAPATQPSVPAENLHQAPQTQDWDRWEEVQRQRESRKSVRELHNDAYRAYRQNQYELAVTLFAEATELARQQGDIAAHAKNLHWEGDALSLDNQLEKALTRLFLADALNALDPITQFYNLLKIVDVARRIPLPLTEQEHLLAKLAPYKGNQQIGGSRSMVLSVENFLFTDRGMYAELLARSQEALASRVNRAPFYGNEVYFEDLIDSYRLMGQFAQARQILRQWQAEAKYAFADEKSSILYAEAKLLYSEGHSEAAWDMMQRVYAEERYIQRAGKEPKTLLWMIRIGSELGHFEQIRPLVFQILRFRRSESHLVRYDCNLSLARYCCQACIHGGLPAKDTARMRHHARFWLRQAEESAWKLDTLLECDWRTKETHELREQYTASI